MTDTFDQPFFLLQFNKTIFSKNWFHFLIFAFFSFRYANSIYYTALKTVPSVIMTWTEQNINNQTRCGIVKYTLKQPSLDNIEDIFDYSYLQHDIKSLFAVNGKSIACIFNVSFPIIIILILTTVFFSAHTQITMLLDVAIELFRCGTIEMVICWLILKLSCRQLDKTLAAIPSVMR